MGEPRRAHFNPSEPDFSFPLQGNGLELRILANDADDKQAIEEASRLINQGDAIKAELEELQAKGLPPPGPRWPGPEKVPRAFIIRLSLGKMSKVSYGWVELGPSERAALQLDNTAKKDPERNENWNEAARSRGKATQLTSPFGGGNIKLLQGALFYSRDCKNQNLPDEERQKKGVDYFVLARNPEIDVDGLILPRGKPKAITGEHLLSADRGMKDRLGRVTIVFSINDVGGRLLHELTEKNSPSIEKPERPFKRHLAIIVNGLAVSAPTIDSPIKNHGMISGDFNPIQVESLLKFLRGNHPGKK